MVMLMTMTSVHAEKGKTMSDYISRADAIGAVQDHFNDDGFKGYDDGQKMMDRITALPSANIIEFDFTKHQPRVRNKVNDSLPSADRPTSDDLIIKNGKGIQDGLYNIHNGEIFKYKAKGGTVRAYKLVPSVSAERVDDDDDDLDGLKIIAIIDGKGGAE